MPLTEKKDGLVSTEGLRATVDQTIFQVEGEETQVTLSMVVTPYANGKTTNIDALLKRASKEAKP
jgi:hypothetical protein